MSALPSGASWAAMTELFPRRDTSAVGKAKPTAAAPFIRLRRETRRAAPSCLSRASSRVSGRVIANSFYALALNLLTAWMEGKRSTSPLVVVRVASTIV